MSFASTSRQMLGPQLRRRITVGAASMQPQQQRLRPAVVGMARQSLLRPLASSSSMPLRLIAGGARYASSTPTAAPGSVTAQQQINKAKQEQQQQEQEEEEYFEEDPEPEPKSFRERMRFLWRRYGWWALGVYQLASIVDISLTFGAIHMLGAEHIRKLETKLREAVGLGEREMEDHEVAVWPVGEVLPDGTLDAASGKAAENNVDAARTAAKVLQGKADPPAKAVAKSGSGTSNSTLWAEAVLAYTIHKTLLLPFRVMITAAVTPSFVKKMVQWGWAKPNNLVKVGKLGKGKAMGAVDAASKSS